MDFLRCLSGMETYLNSRADDLANRISASLSDLISTVPWLTDLIKEADELIASYSVKIKLISLGTLVPNSRDRHEKQWRPDFTRHKTHPKIRFV